MQTIITSHLFDFWATIGSKNNSLNHAQGFDYTNQNSSVSAWPSRIFNVNVTQANLNTLYLEMSMSKLPNILSIPEDTLIESCLLDHKFKLKSEVKAMALSIDDYIDTSTTHQSIDLVETEQHVQTFAQIASQAFGYQITAHTISNIYRNTQTMKLYLGKYNNEYASCGIVFFDNRGYSGIHMIGTLPNYRGVGLGKQMTDKLISEAKYNSTNDILLVASKAGARIYSKLGFKTKGSLKSYIV